MISGVRASSTRMESTSSTMAKLCAALHHLGAVVFHVVAQIVEAEFVVGGVGDVAGIGLAALVVVMPWVMMPVVRPRKP
jgi:hypothetical protein